VRSICPECKTEYKLDTANIEALSKEFHLEKLISILIKEKLIPAKTKDIKDIKFFKGKGCDKCGHTGYKGRLGIHEILDMTPKIGEMIMAHKSAGEIQDEAEKNGMTLMWEDGFIKAVKGITTVDEILRVSKE
jgi:general secretion pathway protein E